MPLSNEVEMWEKLSKVLYEKRDKYERMGIEGIPYLELEILPLIERFESGERSYDLHAMLLDLKSLW